MTKCDMSEEGTPEKRMKPLRILTWHVHGSYLYYLTHRPPGVLRACEAGKTRGLRWQIPAHPGPDNLHDVPAEEVRNLQLDCIL